MVYMEGGLIDDGIQSEWHSFPAESTREKHLTLPTERGKKKEKEMKGGGEWP